MAVRSDRTVRTPRSTGKVVTPAAPVTSTQPDSGESTGAVGYDSPGTTVVEHLDRDPVVISPMPREPVTMTVSWLGEGNDPVDTAIPADAQSKMVTGAGAGKPKPARSSQRVQTA